MVFGEGGCRGERSGNTKGGEAVKKAPVKPRKRKVLKGRLIKGRGIKNFEGEPHEKRDQDGLGLIRRPKKASMRGESKNSEGEKIIKTT